MLANAREYITYLYSFGLLLAVSVINEKVSLFGYAVFLYPELMFTISEMLNFNKSISLEKGKRYFIHVI